MPTRLLILFVLGIIYDIIFTLNISHIASKRILPAAVTSFILTCLSMFVFALILKGIRVNEISSFVDVFAYALGGSVGVVLTMKAGK